MEKKGKNLFTIKSNLKKKLKADISFRSGKILGSMCTKPHPVAIRIFHKYIEKNIGDTGLVRDSKELEKEVIRNLGQMLHTPEASGHIVTGGTEANILAMWTAKKLCKHKGNELIVPESAHFSFDKAAELLDLQLIKVPLDQWQRMDVEALKKCITSDTMGIVAVAGSTPLGMIDPISAIAEIANAQGIYLHVDAAFGGYVIPFMPDADKPEYQFDFRLTGVCSITIDPHKMGMATIPAGGIIYRNKELAETVKIHVPYLSGGETKQSTIVGTRAGASVIAVWALLEYMGYDGYKRIVRRCLDLTTFLVKEIAKINGIGIIVKPDTNVVGITTTCMTVEMLAERLREQGWAVALFNKHIRICMMPHVKKAHLVQFVKALKVITGG